MNFFDYKPYMGEGMARFQTGQQPVDAKYLSDPMTQKLFGDQVRAQLVNAFAPQQGQGGFLEQLLASVPAAPPPPPEEPVIDPKKKDKTKVSNTTTAQRPAGPTGGSMNDHEEYRRRLIAGGFI